MTTRWICISYLVLLWHFPQPVAAESPREFLTPHQDRERWGFQTPDGKFRIEPKYENVRAFSEGLAAIQAKGLWGFVSEAGVEVIRPRFQQVLPFSEGLAAVQFNDKWGYVDKSGEQAIPLNYTSCRSFSEGVACVRNETLWGYIDRTGKEAIPLRYRVASSFREGLAAAAEGGGAIGFIDRTGTTVIAASFEDSSQFREGRAAVFTKEGWTYIGAGGKALLENKFDFAGSFYHGYAQARNGNDWYLISDRGKVDKLDQSETVAARIESQPEAATVFLVPRLRYEEDPSIEFDESKLKPYQVTSGVTSITLNLPQMWYFVVFKKDKLHEGVYFDVRKGNEKCIGHLK